MKELTRSLSFGYIKTDYNYMLLLSRRSCDLRALLGRNLLNIHMAAIVCITDRSF